LRHLPRPRLLPYTTLFRSTCKPEGGGFQDRCITNYATPPQKQDSLAGIVREAGWRGQIEYKKGGQGRLHELVMSALWRFISFLRSEEHTSELQSRENLVCR